MAMQDRRKHKRRYLLYYARIFNADTSEMVGHLVDLTPEGLMMVSEKPILPGKQYNFRLELSEDISESQFLDFKACSVWCKPSKIESYYNVGFQTQSLTNEETAIVHSIVRSYGFRDR